MISQRARLFIKNIVRVVGANLSRIVTSFILTLLLPKLLHVEDYGYWQLYIFYGSYLGYSALGWSEGTLLKYAGEDYDGLDGRALSSQFWNLAVYEALFVTAAFLLGRAAIADPRKFLALALALAHNWVLVLKGQLQMILQATNRFSEYARGYTGERILYFVLVIACLMLGRRNFFFIALMEIISTTVLLIVLMFSCREVTFRKPLSLKKSLPLTRELIRMGISIMLASVAGMLIIGIVRFAIEEHWGTVVFGKVSLSLSMANMLITCISAVGVVLYPMINRADRDKLFAFYKPARTCMTALMYGLLLFYVPGKMLLGMWLPQYRESLNYLAVLFPLCIYEARTSVLTVTYLKALRREKDILWANLGVMLLSLLTTFITVHVLGSLDLAVLSIIVLYAVKGIVMEALLARHMPLRLGREHVLEAALTLAFILSNALLPNGAATVTYLAAYIIWLLLQRRNVVSSVGTLRDLMMEGEQAA